MAAAGVTVGIAAAEDVITAAGATAAAVGGGAAAAAAVEAIGVGLTACGRGALTTTATSLWKGRWPPQPQGLVGRNFGLLRERLSN